MEIDPKKYGMTSSEVIDQAMRLLKEGQGIWVDKSFDTADMIIKKITAEDLEQLDNDESKMHCVCMEMRPGAHLFYSHLEYTYFPPEQPVNKQFEYRVFRWNGYLWQIGSVPVNKKPLCQASAAHAKMLLQDAIPFFAGIILASARDFANVNRIFGQTKILKFPMQSKRVFTLENGKGKPFVPTEEQKRWEYEELKKIYDRQEKHQQFN